MPGFCATIVVDDPAGCPAACVSATLDEPVDSVSWSRTTADGPIVGDLTVPTATPVETETETELSCVQQTDRETVYRFERDDVDNCVCTFVERTGTPISSVRCQDGALWLTVRARDVDEVATIVTTLKEQFDGVLIDELVESDSTSTTDPVIIDRKRLTDRQREIVETATEMGYFEYPKGANATEVADELGIARSTFSEHLAAAQTKLFDTICNSHTQHGRAD